MTKITVLPQLFNSNKAAYWRLVGLVFSLLPILIFSMLETATNPVLQFDRVRIADGEWWRLYTGNWVHFGWQHTAMNFAGMLAIAGLLFWQRQEKAWWLGLAIIPWCVGFGLYLGDESSYIYRGFSGAAYGFLILGLMLEWRYSKLVVSLVIAILLGKIIYEQLPNYDVDYLREQIGVPVAVDAHLWGVISGILLAVATVVYKLIGQANQKKR